VIKLESADPKKIKETSPKAKLGFGDPPCVVQVYKYLFSRLERQLRKSSLSHLEEVGVPEGGGEAENVVSLGVLGDRLHDGAVDDNKVFRRRLD